MVISTLILYPTADSSTLEWTPKTGTDHYTMVDDKLADDDTTYVWASGGSLVDLYSPSEIITFPDQNISIEKITMTIRARRGTDACEYQTWIKMDNIVNTSIPVFDLTSSYVNYTATYPYIDSGNLVPWTKSDFEESNIFISCYKLGNPEGGMRVTLCNLTIYWQKAVVPGYGRVTWTP
jgi:hypothetical protein